MTPIKEIGECLITAGEDEFFFRPSFLSMMRIGEPQEIVQAFYDVHNDEVTPLLQRALDAYGKVPDWLVKFIGGQQMAKAAVSAAMNIIAACCDRDVSRLTGELEPGKTGRRAFMFRPGLMSPPDMVLIAQSLITHGIIGKAKIRQLQRHEGGQGVSEFNAFEYISAACNHFAMARDDAAQLSMTEFQHRLAAKYPDQKGMTRDEYDQVKDDYLAKKARKLAKAKAA